MPSSCHGCFGISFSCWPPGALLASVFKGNVGTGRPYCLCHESLLASSALLFSPLNGEIRSGGTEKGKEERSRVLTSRLLRAATKTVLPTPGCILVSPLFSFSPLLFAGSAAAGGSISKCMVPLHAFQAVAFRELFEREKPAVFWWALLCKNQAGRGKRRAQPGSDHCHLLTHRAGLCDGLSRTFH